MINNILLKINYKLKFNNFIYVNKLDFSILNNG